MTTATRMYRGSGYCRPEALHYFYEQLPRLGSTEGLVRAAIAVSMHAIDDLDPDRVERQLRILSLRVRERSPSLSEPAILANLHSVLFDEEGFRGNLKQYYNALNSYLPAVLSARSGLPNTLALIYKAVGEWAGLEVEGLNTPGHFLARIRCDGRWMIVDPFFGGQVLTRDEAYQRLDQVHGGAIPRSDAFLSPATHEQWLGRILGNLRHLFATEGRRDDLAAMIEFTSALTSYASN
jgi:regulator of sirC expression with transglutaminase-like and TPR domain